MNIRPFTGSRTGAATYLDLTVNDYSSIADVSLLKTNGDPK
jgi:hypothetical protein